jgi:hypothetical protein
VLVNTPRVTIFIGLYHNMKIAIHQPEHFPYMGFFDKMQSVDVFVLLDNVKFNRRNFQHRNKIENHRGEAEWFGMQVPRESKYQLINQVIPVPTGSWRDSTIKQLKREVNVDTTEIYKHSKLVDINMASIEWARDKLKITTPMLLASNMTCTGSKSELLISICKAIDTEEHITYVSGSGGRNYMDMELFKQNEIDVTYHESDVPNYYSCLYNLK